MATVVQSMIPERYLLAHAVYMQTCAHIELATWHIVMIIDGCDPDDPSQIDRFLKIKRHTPTLIVEFEDCAKRCAPDLSARVLELVHRIRVGVENRNLAAHGAFHWDQEANHLKAEHYIQREVYGEKRWFHTAGEAIGEAEIVSAIEDADSILREAHAILTALRNR